MRLAGAIFADIGRRFGVTGQRVRQILSRVRGLDNMLGVDVRSRRG